MKIDAVASLRCWAVNVRLGGHDYRIPPMPAADWLEAITGYYHQIVPGMVQDDDNELADAIIGMSVSTAECNDAAREVIAEISGMKWWTAARLSSYLMSNWGVLGGELLTRGMNPATAPLGAVLTLTYRILLENCKGEQERGRVDLELDRVPPGTPIGQMFDAKQAAANFMALANSGG